MLRKIGLWLFGAFIIFFIATRPAAAAHTAKWLGGILITVGTGFGDFFSRLVS